MNDLKTELWNGHEIRFVEKGGEWWAVAKDVTDALGFSEAKNGTRKIPKEYKGVTKVTTTSAKAKCPEAQEMICLSELGLYRLIMRSNKPEAEAFQMWVYSMLKELRKATGLEGFEIFRMLDKEHQKQAMCTLCQGLHHPVRVDFIKANTIANKAVSNKHGYEKMVKKAEMTPQMLIDRQSALNDTVELMSVQDKYGLDFSVSERVNMAITGKQESERRA